ncbi:hypothetical protein CER18_06795 [Bartonella tribocorum]|uniref:Uncharacterized protein n=1 Tax=Bartonella tribocorum TaxID=85701 RepID=A0A2M6UQK0_9HYPH|nr:hypothetical protein CER18_06795 [Bartonella tribocorum]
MRKILCVRMRHVGNMPMVELLFIFKRDEAKKGVRKGVSKCWCKGLREKWCEGVKFFCCI